MKPLTVTRDIYTDYLLKKVFHALRNDLSFQRHTPVLVQQGNARPHVRRNDPEVLRASRRGHQKIVMSSQSPNSPDINALDLVFFKSL